MPSVKRVQSPLRAVSNLKACSYGDSIMEEQGAMKLKDLGQEVELKTGPKILFIGLGNCFYSPNWFFV